MPSTITSPYASAFKSALKRGTSYNDAVNSIAVRHKKSPKIVWNSLHRAGLCFKQKFNGQFIFIPWEAKKTNGTIAKLNQFNTWQWFTEWCISSGFCTPDQAWNHCGPQKDFMIWYKKFFGRQFDGISVSPSRRRSTSKRRSTVKSSSTTPLRRKTTKKRTITRKSNFRVPTTRSRAKSRVRSRRAA